MKLTKRQLVKLIKEELAVMEQEATPADPAQLRRGGGVGRTAGQGPPTEGEGQREAWESLYSNLNNFMSSLMPGGGTSYGPLVNQWIARGDSRQPAGGMDDSASRAKLKLIQDTYKALESVIPQWAAMHKSRDNR